MALRKKHHNSVTRYARAIEHTGFYPYLARFLEHSAMLNGSSETAKRRNHALRRFIEWCDERGLHEPREITKPVLERYRRHLYYYRKADGSPLTFGSQNVMLTPIKAFFRWLTRENYLLYNPASELELPKKARRLPRAILSVEQIEQVMALADVGTPSGLRDRAILETLYSTGLRRTELCALKVYDLEPRRGLVFVREGKGCKDRMVPIGERALAWVLKYQEDARRYLLSPLAGDTLFLTDFGEPFKGAYLAWQVKRYMNQAGLVVTGSCHLFRHAMATHMLENGADIRFIQAMLGHDDLNSTQIYTQVSVQKLREIHAATHPAKLGKRGDTAALLDRLMAESVAEDADTD